MTVVLVTGAAGFAGGYLARELESRDAEVWRAVHEPSEGAAGPGAGERERVVDVRDRERVLEAVRDVEPDEIYHLAGVTHPALHAATDFWRANVLGTVHVLEAARQVGASVLVVSSGYVYGPVNAPAAEEAPLRPVNHYGASKVGLEMAARAEAIEGLDVVVARPFNHSGPGQPPDYLVPTLVQQVAGILDGSRPARVELGNLESVRDFTDVRDVVRAYPIVLRAAEPGDVLNVCSGRGVSVSELVDVVAAVAGIELDVVSTPTRRRAADIPYLVGDPSRAEAVGWERRFGLEETIRAMLAHVRGGRA